MCLLHSKFGIWWRIWWNSLVMRNEMSLSKLSSPFFDTAKCMWFFKQAIQCIVFLSANIRKLQLKSFVAIITAGQNQFPAQFNKRKGKNCFWMQAHFLWWKRKMFVFCWFLQFGILNWNFELKFFFQILM